VLSNLYAAFTSSQAFALTVKPEKGEQKQRYLNNSNFPNVEFVGEYPIGRVRYARAKDDPFSVEVSLEAFSPFIPLNAKDSGIRELFFDLNFRTHRTNP